MKDKVKLIWSDLYDCIFINGKKVCVEDSMSSIEVLKLLKKHNVIDLEIEELSDKELIANYYYEKEE